MNWQRFCHPDYPDGVPRMARDLVKPFIIGGWRYASDARIAVRARTDAPDTEGLSDYVRQTLPPQFEGLDWSGKHCCHPLPKTTEARVTGYDWCESCADICECQADDRRDGCSKCVGGFRYRKDCPECKGTGRVFFSNHYYYRFDGITVNGKYLALLWEELTGPCYAKPAKPMAVLQIRSVGPIDEVQGILAQMKVRSDERHLVEVDVGSTSSEGR